MDKHEGIINAGDSEDRLRGLYSHHLLIVFNLTQSGVEFICLQEAVASIHSH